MRAFDNSLRGIKVSAFLLVGVVTLLVTASTLSRPTHAEGPLTQTVKCLVNTLLFTPCQAPQTPAISSSGQSQSQASQPAAPAPSGSNNASAPSVQQENQSAGVPQSTQPLNPVAPLAVDTPTEIAAMPQTSQQHFNNPKSYDYVAFFNTSSPYAHAAVHGDANPFIQPSKEGWKVAGMAWYWWIGIIAAITGGIWGVRQIIVRKFAVGGGQV